MSSGGRWTAVRLETRSAVASVTHDWPWSAPHTETTTFPWYALSALFYLRQACVGNPPRADSFGASLFLRLFWNALRLGAEHVVKKETAVDFYCNDFFWLIKICRNKLRHVWPLRWTCRQKSSFSLITKPRWDKVVFKSVIASSGKARNHFRGVLYVGLFVSW